jgi:hypothetical protein
MPLLLNSIKTVPFGKLRRTEAPKEARTGNDVGGEHGYNYR